MTLDNSALQRLSESQTAAPMSTQVIDHRTRTQHRFGENVDTSGDANGSSSAGRRDIRAGKWLEGKPRIGRQE